jgi:hypothetical protein
MLPVNSFPLLSESFILKIITGMNPKASIGNRFRSKLRDNSANKLLFASFLKFESHYPPLREIVQLTNFPTLRYGNWSFTNKKGFEVFFKALILLVAGRGFEPLTFGL